MVCWILQQLVSVPCRHSSWARPIVDSPGKVGKARLRTTENPHGHHKIETIPSRGHGAEPFIARVPFSSKARGGLGDQPPFRRRRQIMHGCGGNATTRYNFRNDTTNRAADWFLDASAQRRRPACPASAAMTASSDRSVALVSRRSAAVKRAWSGCGFGTATQCSSLRVHFAIRAVTSENVGSGLGCSGMPRDRGVQARRISRIRAPRLIPPTVRGPAGSWTSRVLLRRIISRTGGGSRGGSSMAARI